MSASSSRGKSCKKSGSEPSQPDVISLSAFSTWTGLSDPSAFDFIQRACELIAPLNLHESEIRARFARAFFPAPVRAVGARAGSSLPDSGENSFRAKDI